MKNARKYMKKEELFGRTDYMLTLTNQKKK